MAPPPVAVETEMEAPRTPQTSTEKKISTTSSPLSKEIHSKEAQAEREERATETQTVQTQVHPQTKEKETNNQTVAA